MGYQLITNRIARPLLSIEQLTPKQRSDFDYVSEDDFSLRFVEYRGSMYDALDAQRIEPDNRHSHPVGWAMRVHPGEPLASFDSFIGETYFSGVAFRFVDDGDSVVIARIFS